MQMYYILIIYPISQVSFLTIKPENYTHFILLFQKINANFVRSVNVRK